MSDFVFGQISSWIVPFNLQGLRRCRMGLRHAKALKIALLPASFFPTRQVTESSVSKAPESSTDR